MLTESFSALRAHVCGYAPRHRWGKPLAFLQAYTDDSVAETGERRLFLAGYLNRADAWELFSEAWDEELQRSPKIEYFKMREARALRDQFHGFSGEQRDEKIRQLARIIAHFKPISFEFSVGLDPFSEFMTDDVPHGLSDPRFSSAFAVISMLTGFVAESGYKLPIDFIFDEMEGVDINTLILFDLLRKGLPKNRRRLISGLPMFLNDRNFVQLQAADMLVWHLRRQHEIGDVESNIMNKLVSENAHVTSEMPESMIESISSGLKRVHNVENIQSKKDWKKTLRSISALDAIKRKHPIRHRLISFYFNSYYAIDSFLARFKRR